MITTEIEQTQARQRAQNPSEQKEAEEALARLKASSEMWANMEQQCQTTEIEAGAQFRTEQAKMSDLQDRLDKHDKILARYSGK